MKEVNNFVHFKFNHIGNVKLKCFRGNKHAFIHYLFIYFFIYLFRGED